MSQPREQAIFKDARRLEAFSDGVFAIAITLLILEIKVPSAENAATPALLWAALLARWPSYFAFLLSFGTILIAWVGHHLLLQEVRRVTPELVWANGLLLLIITFLPFPTSLVAEHLTHPSGSVAAAVYAGVNALNGLMFLLMFLAVRASAAETGSKVVSSLHRPLFGALMCGAAALVAFVSPVASLLVVAAVWTWWGVTSLTESRGRAP